MSSGRAEAHTTYGDLEALEDIEALEASLRAELAERSLIDFARTVVPGYQAPRHIVQLAEALEAVERGEINRLAIFEPPRHGKSLLCSRIFPAWALGRQPTRQIVQSGYAQSITNEHSRGARDLFQSEAMRALFPEVHFSKERLRRYATRTVEPQAAHEWGTAQGGRYYAVGVGGGLVGRGADIALIDDPVKNREEANSETVRKKVWEWYTSTLRTRLSPEGAIVLIMTRWHEDDLAGRLLKADEEGSGEHWTQICLPAIDSDGAALWPERWTQELLAQVRAAIGTREWEAQYQQHPVPLSGNLFDLSRMVEHDSTEHWPSMPEVRFWDLASSEKQRAKSDPDWTVGCRLGVTYAEGLPVVWIRDLARIQAQAPARDVLIRSTAAYDGPAIPVLIESVAGYKDTADTMADVLRGLRSVKPVKVTKDKVARAAPLEPVFQAGNVHVLKSAPWLAVFKAEFAAFPHGGHDDIVDAVAGAYAGLYRVEVDWNAVARVPRTSRV